MQKIESFNCDKLFYIIRNFDTIKKQLRPSVLIDNNYNPLSLCSMYLKKSNRGEIKTSYKQKNNKGRYFASRSLSMQCMPREIRSTVADGFYTDIDIKNAHPVILSFMCKENGFKSDILDLYIKDREIILKDTKLEREDAKELFLCLLNGGKKIYNGLKFKNKFMKQFRDELINIHKNFSMKYPKKFIKCKKGRILNNKDYNHEASFTNHLICDMENKILMEIYKYFREPDNVVFCFDGLMLRNNKEYDLRECEKHIKNVLDISIELCEKPFKDILKLPSDIPKYEQRKEYTELELLVKDILKDSEKNEYKKEDGYIMKKIVNNYYEQHMTYEDYINKLFINFSNPNYDLLRRNVKNYDDLVKYLNKINDIKLSFIIRDYTKYAFNNGVLDIEKLTFSKKINSDICCSKYFDCDFDENILKLSYDEIQTPNFDKLCKTQVNKVYDYFLSFIGRLFFKLSKDNWQCSPFIVGPGNTGKSTVFNIIRYLFLNIGSLGDNTESKFGLEGLFDKQVILCPEIPEDMNKVMPRTQFQSVVSGEIVNISRKNKISLNKKWDVPIMMAGNYLPNYDDKSGSISRRLAIFKFEKEITVKDTKLESNIIKYELSNILIKCIKAYNMMLERHDTQAFEDWDIKYFINNREELKEQSNPFYSFLVNVNEKFNIEFEKDNNNVSLQDLKTYYGYYMKFKNPNTKYKWSNSNLYVLNKLGYDVKRVNICSSCNKKARLGCCDKYNTKNRKRSTVILNMKITRKD